MGSTLYGDQLGQFGLEGGGEAMDGIEAEAEISLLG
ncbi:MAG: hypothetical protein ACI90Z_002267 [Cyanobium sp.]